MSVEELSSAIAANAARAREVATALGGSKDRADRLADRIGEKPSRRVSFETDLGIYPIHLSKEVEAELLRRFEAGATSLELTEYVVAQGVQPPTGQPGWVVAVLRLEGRNRGGDHMMDYYGFVWSEPGYAFSHGAHHEFADNPSAWEPAKTAED